MSGGSLTQLINYTESFIEHTAHAQTVHQSLHEAACGDVYSPQQGIHNSRPHIHS